MTSRFPLFDDVNPAEEDEQMRVMADMAQIIAHRIRGLVTTIEGFTDLLMDSLGDREQREQALRIFESAARIESVLADLQMFARPVRPVPASTTLDAVLRDLEAAVDDDVRARLEITGAPPDVRLRIDRMLVRQALLVLVQNAREASAAGALLGIRAETDEASMRLHVWNPGVIRDEVAQSAFKPFYTTKAHNLGVGLPIALRIAAAHGGSLELTSSDEEAGTCFTLVLPLETGVVEG